MIYKDYNFSELIVKKTYIKLGETIADALKSLSESGLRICIVLDNKKFFKGVLNDGDIRRALLNGNDLKTKIDNIYNKRPVVVGENTSKKIILNKLSNIGVDHAPYVKNGKVVGIFNSNNYLSKKLKTRVIVMCGGLGTRLKPTTIRIPKALVKVNNVPMLSIVIKNIKKYGLDDFILATYYKSKLIKNFYKNGKSHNIKIKYISEKKPLGTAGPMSLIDNKIKDNFFLVTNCDVISDINYENLIEFHKNNKAALTIAVKKFTSINQFGEIDLKGINVKKIIEKPKKNITINAGIYVFSKICLKYLMYNEHIDMNDFIMKLIKKNKKIIAYPFYDNWYDLGTKNELKNFRKFSSNKF